jgi:hypothetical protein
VILSVGNDGNILMGTLGCCFSLFSLGLFVRSFFFFFCSFVCLLVCFMSHVRAAPLHLRIDVHNMTRFAVSSMKLSILEKKNFTCLGPNGAV